MSLSPEQRAQVLHLHHVEGVSAVLIATMTGLSVSVVRKVVQESRQQNVLAVDRAHPMRPSSKARIECEIRAAREPCAPPRPAVPPLTRRPRRERRHDRT